MQAWIMLFNATLVNNMKPTTCFGVVLT
jgi:hypothetical protein